jgi:predicted ester cyclase
MLFPGAQVVLEDLVAESDKAVMRFRFQGTHKADFMGVAPTGKQTDVKVMSITIVADGKFAEAWQIYDALGMFQQLSVTPPM